MQTQITCPNCRNPFAAQVYNVIDADRTPELKQMLLSGVLNVATCPSCGTPTQLAVPLGYHDASHELFMVHVPMELNLPLPERERMIGQMTKAITDGVPQEKFKAYLLQPQEILTMQTFMEKVFATEGVTPEMLQHQRDQSRLLQDLVLADRERQKQLIEDNLDKIDETFFAMLAGNLQMAEQSPQGNQAFIKLTNLQARLFTMTEVGRSLEKRQMALRAFQQAAQKRGGLTLDLFLDTLIQHLDDEAVLDAVIDMGQQAIRYELFSRLTERIDKATSTQDKNRLIGLRSKLLEIYESLQKQAQVAMAEAEELLDRLIKAPDVVKVIEQDVGRIDDTFIYFLSSQIKQAEQIGDQARLADLKRVHEAIMDEAEKQMPPELRLLNVLLSTDDEQMQRQLLDGLPQEARPQLAALLQMMEGELATSDPQISRRLEKIQAMLA